MLPDLRPRRQELTHPEVSLSPSLVTKGSQRLTLLGSDEIVPDGEVIPAQRPVAVARPVAVHSCTTHPAHAPVPHSTRPAVLHQERKVGPEERRLGAAVPGRAGIGSDGPCRMPYSRNHAPPGHPDQECCPHCTGEEADSGDQRRWNG